MLEKEQQRVLEESRDLLLDKLINVVLFNE